MNLSKYFKAFAALIFGGSVLTGCQDKFDDVAVEVPVATQTANITIADFKAMFWQDEASNYCDEIPAREDGTHYVIKGRVVSSDYEGNIFKKLVIQDETAALAMSINQYNLYLLHRVGQELVIDLTGMYAGKYAGCFQLGFPSWYANGNTWQTSFMAPELFNSHCELNGLPEPAKVDTMLIENFSTIGSSPAELQKWQSQLIRLNNVKFANAGVEGATLCANYKTSVSDEQNQALNVGDTQVTVRTSGYSRFWNTPLPASEFDIVGILDYYNGNWQLILNDANGLMNIGNPTNKGSKNDPYTITDAINVIKGGSSSASGWVGGYIIGTVAPEVTEIKTLADITTAEPFIMNNSLVIVDNVDNYDISNILIVNLPQGTPIAEYGNLVDNPDNLGKFFKVQGRLGEEMNANAVINNTGTVSTFEIEGLELEDPNAPVESGDGTEAKPYNVTQVIALNNPGTTAWVEGFIVGYYDYDNNSALVTAAGSVNSCVAIAADPNETDKTKTVAVQLPVGDIRSAVNLTDHPENLGKKLAIQGSLTKYFGLPGVKDATAFKLNGEGSGSGGDTPVTPPADGNGDGTKESPYNCAAVIALNNPGTKAWVKGYIVGVYNYDNNSALEASAGSVNTCVAIADNPNETDKNKTVAVQLPVGDIRTAVNLVDHPENFGKLLSIEGELIKYFGLPGVKNATAYELEGAGSGGDTPVTPPSGDVNGDGSETSPYDVADVLTLNVLDGSVKGWVEGYIVGSIKNSAPVFGTEGAANTNLLLAASATETDYAKCIPVELPSGSIRTALNIVDNPSLVGKKVMIDGTLTKYFSRAGLKAPTAYKTL